MQAGSSRLALAISVRSDGLGAVNVKSNAPPMGASIATEKVEWFSALALQEMHVPSLLARLRLSNCSTHARMRARGR